MSQMLKRIDTTGLLRRTLSKSTKYDSIEGPEPQLRRKHNVIPWIDDPTSGCSTNVFHQRHEANTIELFFDLFFVANLATFTAFHSILDIQALGAYIGFFAVIWCTWFQITLYDVRFSRDSVYERICKFIQMSIFVAFALIGSKFQPSSKKSAENRNFKVLCFALGLSRALLSVQYMVVLGFCMRKKFRQLVVPLMGCIATFIVTATVFFLMTMAFRNKVGTVSRGIYSIWWIVMSLEALIIIAISCTWRMLSFKATHLPERLGLLTLIVIGEGAIGVSKTVSKIMGKNGPDFDNTFLIGCIVLILVFLWMLYFDNQPKQHYGSIRQQIWSVLHFPLHIGIVGVVEGAQQLVLAHYVLHNTSLFEKKVDQSCYVKKLDGMDLTDALLSAVDYYSFDDKPETMGQSRRLKNTIYRLGNTTSVCSDSSILQQNKTNGYTDIDLLVNQFTGALFQANGAKLPKEIDPTVSSAKAFLIAYQNFWVSFSIVLACSMLFLWLVRSKYKADVFDWVSMITRFLGVIISLTLFGVTFKKHNGKPNTVSHTVANLLKGPFAVPIAVLILFGILGIDQLARIYCNWKLKGKRMIMVDEDRGDEDSPENLCHSPQQVRRGLVTITPISAPDDGWYIRAPNRALTT